MTLEEQGAYRNLLDEAHLRGGPLPKDERILAKACGDALTWERVRSAVIARFVLHEDGWRNETLDEVYAKTMKLSRKRSKVGQLGGIRSGEARRKAKREAKQQATTNSPSPSPSPSLVSESVSVSVVDSKVIDQIRKGKDSFKADSRRPQPPKGGFIPRDIRERAKHVREKARGRCTHQPKCRTYDACVDKIAREIQEQIA